MAKRLGNSLETGNLVLGTAAPAMGRFSGGMGGGGAGMANRRQERATSSGRKPIVFDRPTSDPRIPETAIP